MPQIGLQKLLGVFLYFCRRGCGERDIQGGGNPFQLSDRICHDQVIIHYDKGTFSYCTEIRDNIDQPFKIAFLLPAAARVELRAGARHADRIAHCHNIPSI